MLLGDLLRARIGRRLERGDPSAAARAAGALWGVIGARAVARPLVLPAGAAVIGVGSAVLGGAGKTPLAIGIARELGARGEAVALIGHGYRAEPGRARRVRADDAPGEVGDEALAAARLLEGSGVGVWVGRRRQEAVDAAAESGGRVLVVDGMLQAAPVRVAAAILVMDAGAPWGSGRCPPAGDLRAPREALLGAADVVAVIGAESEEEELPREVPAGAIGVGSRVDSVVDADGEVVAVGALAGRRVGLLLTTARPERIERALKRAGIVADPVMVLGDHARASERDLERAARAGVEMWLTTARCATKLPARIGGAAVGVMDHRLEVAGVVDRVMERLGRR